MIAMQVVACLGIMAGCFLLFGISLTDYKASGRPKRHPGGNSGTDTEKEKILFPQGDRRGAEHLKSNGP